MSRRNGADNFSAIYYYLLLLLFQGLEIEEMVDL